ncbi:MAG: signal recognition particle-docking protein FtsY [Oceanicoccus sp.]
MKFFDRFKSAKPDQAPAEQQPSTEASDRTPDAPVEQEILAGSTPSGSSAEPAAELSTLAAAAPIAVDVPVEPIIVAKTESDLNVESVDDALLAATDTVDTDSTKEGFFSRLKQGLKRTTDSFSSGMGTLFLGKKEIDEELLEELETQLLIADVGVEATRDIMESLAKQISRRELADPQALYRGLQKELAELLAPSRQPLQIDVTKKPYVILIVGVNGVGKTTTIGKLSKRFQAEGKSVMLAAGDTFRAAAVEQLQVWGERNNVPVIAQHTGADSASVIFDAVQAAQARKVDVLIADTAGRLHNKDNLMEELKKVVRVMGKLDSTAPHEVMLVLDAGTGQNALSQAKAFQQVVGVTGITITKLDGTAKGGIIFAISKQLQLPIRFIGVGEQIDDLRPFAADDFVAALFNIE